MNATPRGKPDVRGKYVFLTLFAFAGFLTAEAFIRIPFTNAPITLVQQAKVKGKVSSLLPAGKEWKLVFHDEFDQKEIDRSKWMCRESFWGCDFPAFAHAYEGVEMTGETVKLKLLQKGGDFTSPHLQTGSLTYDVPKEGAKGFWPFGRRKKPTFMHKYGYYEIRCRLNRFGDWHAAFWIQAPGIGSHPDPAVAGTEVDIMESWKLGGIDSLKCKSGRGGIVGGVIAGGYGSDGCGFRHFEWPYVETDDGWHNYGLEWTPYGYEFYTDGKKVGEQNCPVSQIEEFVLVSTEPGGYRSIGNDGGLSAARGVREWGKPLPGLARAAAAGDCFEVDYVRVYDNVAGYDWRPEPLVKIAVDPVAPEARPATVSNILSRVNLLSTLDASSLRAATTEEELRRLDSTAAWLLKQPLTGSYGNWMRSVQVSCAKMMYAFRDAPAVEKASETTFLKDAVQPFVDAGRTHGLIGILRNGARSETACIGWADVANRRPITLDDPYMICSQTKGVCGVAAAILVDEGKLKLDDPVEKYIPSIRPWKYSVAVGWTNGVFQTRPCGKIMTVRHLLTHTSGLGFESPVKRELGWTSVPLRVHAALVTSIPLAREPGTRFGYSNWGMDVAARVIEVASGMRFEDFLRERIFEPLGMKSTTFFPTDEMLSRAIQLYEVRMEGPCEWRKDIYTMPCPHNGPDVFPSAGAGLWSTARDFSKFYAMLMNRGVGENGVRILKELTCRDILEKKQTPDGVETLYSLGFHVRGNGWYGHGGAWGTDCEVNPDKKMMRFFVQQIHGEKENSASWPWASAFYGAADEFMRLKGDAVANHDFVGRTE